MLNTDDHNDVDYIAIGDSNLAQLSAGISHSEQTKLLVSAAGSCLVLPDYTTKQYTRWMNRKW